MDTRRRKVGVISLLAVLSVSLCLPYFALAQPVTGGTLTIHITGARNAKGKMLVWLFRDGQGYPEDTAKIYRQQYVDINPKTLDAEASFRDLPEGNYAATVLHDENVNGKLDKNFVGMPKEGYGASNNPKKKMHAPTYDEVKFTIDSREKSIGILLIYW